MNQLSSAQVIAFSKNTLLVSMLSTKFWGKHELVDHKNALLKAALSYTVPFKDQIINFPNTSRTISACFSCFLFWYKSGRDDLLFKTLKEVAHLLLNSLREPVGFTIIALMRYLAQQLQRDLEKVVVYIGVG